MPCILTVQWFASTVWLTFSQCTIMIVFLVSNLEFVTSPDTICSDSRICKNCKFCIHICIEKYYGTAKWSWYTKTISCRHLRQPNFTLSIRKDWRFQNSWSQSIEQLFYLKFYLKDSCGLRFFPFAWKPLPFTFSYQMVHKTIKNMLL